MKRLALALLLGSALVGPAAAVLSSTPVGNASYTMLATDSTLLYTVAFTAPRTVILVSAGASCIGQLCGGALQIIDQIGVVTGTNTLTITPASGETINNSVSSIIIGEPFGRILLVPTSGSNWHIVIYAPGQYPGTTTNDNAPAGSIGEYTSAYTAALASQSATGAAQVVTSAPAMVTTATQTITQVLLTAGDWDCRGQSMLTNVSAANSGTATAATLFSAWTSTSALGPAPGDFANGFVPTNPSFVALQAASVSSPTWSLGLPTVRYSLSASTSIFLLASATFSTGTPTGMGNLSCRRTR